MEDVNQLIATLSTDLDTQINLGEALFLNKSAFAKLKGKHMEMLESNQFTFIGMWLEYLVYVRRKA